jgi:hypothetical protein
MRAEDDLKELVKRLSDAAGTNLLSAVLYGSAAAEDFHEGHSDLNVLCLMQTLGRSDLEKLHAPSAWWAKKGHRTPLFLTLKELDHSADLFAIELLDIKAARRMLFGEDVFATLDVPMNLHRLQVERELRNKTLRLRQIYLSHPGDSRRTLELMTESISSFAALFRHALLAMGQDTGTGKRGAIDRLGSVLGFDPAPLHTVLDVREGRKRGRDLDIQATFAGYLQAISKAADEIDRRFAADSKG